MSAEVGTREWLTAFLLSRFRNPPELYVREVAHDLWRQLHALTPEASDGE